VLVLVLALALAVALGLALVLAQEQAVGQALGQRLVLALVQLQLLAPRVQAARRRLQVPSKPVPAWQMGHLDLL
jgi:hypothetical protein